MTDKRMKFDVPPHKKKIWYAPNKFEAYGEDEIKAVEKCLRDGWLAPGPRTEEFEQKVSKFFGKKSGVFVNSGSSANLLGCCVAGIGPGDEVITPALTFSTTVAPIVQLGAHPVFVDVQARKFVPTVDAIMSKVNKKTKMLMIPNLVGSKIDWKELRAQVNKVNDKIILFEDSCDTLTHTPESDIAACSFYASHIMTCGGGGGIVMFAEGPHQKTALKYRDWGRIGNNTEDMSERFNHSVDGIAYDFKFLYDCFGYNFKSTEMNCAFGLVQFAKIDQLQLKRKQNVQRYIQSLQGKLEGLVVPEDVPIEQMEDWLAMPFLYEKRKELLYYLEDHQIQTRVMFSGNITRHPAYRKFYDQGPFPVADRVMKEGFLLGAHHGLDLEDIDYVCKVIEAYKG